MSDTLVQEVTYNTLSNATGDTVLHENVTTQILSEGVMGPAGPVGPTGPPGTGSSVPWQEDTFVLGGDQTVFVLTTTPATSTVAFFVNGLRQTGGNFTVVGSTVTVTGFTPTTGDTVDIFYQ